MVHAFVGADARLVGPGCGVHPWGYCTGSDQGGQPMKTVIGVVIVVWLVIGAIAAGQRGYFGNDQDVSCKSFSDTALTIIAGPLNYVG